MTASELLRQMEDAEVVDIAECLTIGERVFLASFVGGESAQSLAFIQVRTVLTAAEVDAAWPTLDALCLIEDVCNLNVWRLTDKGGKVLVAVKAK